MMSLCAAAAVFVLVYVVPATLELWSFVTRRPGRSAPAQGPPPPPPPG